MYGEILAEGNCISLKQLAVTGSDIMELGVKQGKQIGDILKELLELVVKDPAKNEREYLLQQAQRYIDQMCL